MFVGRMITLGMAWQFAKYNLLRTLIISTIAVLLYKEAGFSFLAIPFLPIGTIGTAVAFYIGFKNNQAYDRLWEARRLWGGITNTSRNIAAMMLSIVEDKAFVKDFLYRHIAYINILRLQLRREIPWATSKETFHQDSIVDAEELEKFDVGLKRILEENGKGEYFEKFRKKSNTASILLKYQIEKLTELKRQNKIDDFEHSDLVKHINELFNLQGGCERIKSTPLFRQYSVFSRIFVTLFIFLLPFGLLKDLNNLASWGAWLTVPFSLLISWVFFTMEQIGEFSENPFDNGINDTPISTICRNIEIDIKEMLGEDNIPPKLTPHDGILL